MRIPLDQKLQDTNYTPYTISYVIRKRLQIDGYNELPKDKRPPNEMIWDGSPEELDDWMDTVFDRNKSQTVEFDISEDEIG